MSEKFVELVVSLIIGSWIKCIIIIIIIIIRMEAFYSSTCISILLVFEFLILSFNVCILLIAWNK